MRLAPRFFSRRLTSRERRVYRAATCWFVIVSAALVWPLHVPFARIRPFVFGMPFALAFLAALVGVSFLAGLALYRWEVRQGVLDEDAPDQRTPDRDLAD